jgi:hypothetical protein
MKRGKGNYDAVVASHTSVHAAGARRVFAVACLVVFNVVPGPAPAQLLSVDINGTTRSDTTAPGFTRWDVTPDLSGTKRSATRSFTNFVYVFDPVSGLPTATNISSIIACTLAQTYPTAPDTTIYLNANYANKNGNSTSPDPNSGYRLSADA